MSSNPSDKYSHATRASRRKIIRRIIASTATLGAASVFAKSGETPPTKTADIPAASKPALTANKSMAPGIILDHASTSWANIRNDQQRTRSVLSQDNYAALQQLLAEKKYVTIDTPVSTSQTLDLTMKNQRIEGQTGGIITALTGMQNAPLFELKGDATRLYGLIMDNPLLLKSPRGGRQGGIVIAANFCEISHCYFYRMLQAVSTRSRFGAYGTKILNNWFIECLGAGPGDSDLKSSLGEDRGDAVSIWGSGTILTGNHAWLKAGEDARIAFHAEGLMSSDRIRRDIDHKDIIFMNNMAQGAFRRHFAFENITNGVSVGNVSMGGATWWGESYTQCKNVMVDNTIRFDVSPDNRHGQTWRPVKAATAVLNFNQGVTINTNILLAKGTRARGFAIASQIGDHDITLSGNMINEGSEDNTAVWLNNPKNVRLHNLNTTGFKQAVVMLAAAEGQLNSSHCTHQCNGKGAAIVIRNSNNAIVKVSGDNYSGVTSGFKIAQLRELSVTNTTVEATKEFGVFHKINQTLQISGCLGRAEDALPIRYLEELSPSLLWSIENNPGITSTLSWSLKQIKKINSSLNQRGKYAGQNIVLNNQHLLVALGSSPTAPWLDVLTRKKITPS